MKNDWLDVDYNVKIQREFAPTVNASSFELARWQKIEEKRKVIDRIYNAESAPVVLGQRVPDDQSAVRNYRRAMCELYWSFKV